MPEYLSPGVYVEEFEIGAKPIEGVSTSTGGFLGQTERGPTDARFITGFERFQALYGGYIDNSYLAYAIDGFFKNGGQRCFVGRIVGSGATKAHVTVNTIKFEAVGEGDWGKNIAVRIENASLDPSPDPTAPQRSDLFKLIIVYWKNGPPADRDAPGNPQEITKKVKKLIDSATKAEIYDNLSTDPASGNYYLSRLSGRKTTSCLVALERVNDGRPSNTTSPLFTVLSEDGAPGTGFTRDEFLGDPNAEPGEKKGLTAFTEIDEISILYVPDIHCLDTTNRTQLIDDIVSHCENMKDRFAVLDTPLSADNISVLRPPKDSKYAAYYYPWIEIYDPLTKGLKHVPPGGHIAGIYARNDQERGVHKAPANEVVKGAIDLQFQITKREQDLLNPRGVNCIRAFPGRGIRLWGARTVSSDPLWKYVNVRRLFLFLEESIEEATQWVVFEPNDEKLWARVKQSIVQFLTKVWKDGALMGSTPEEAFFVKCDRTTMTQNDIDNGRLIVLIGVAPVKPAEFVIFRIAQWQGGSAVSE